MSSIAARYGFADYKPVYEAAENSEFRKLRPDPHVIRPGDKIVIPEPPRQVWVLETGKRHKIVIKRPCRQIRLKLDAPEGTSFAGQPFELTVGKFTKSGQVTSEDVVEAVVPTTPNEATLSLPKAGLRIKLGIGHLDPVQDGDAQRPVPSGLQTRLANLGLYTGSDQHSHPPKVHSLGLREPTVIERLTAAWSQVFAGLGLCALIATVCAWPVYAAPVHEGVGRLATGERIRVDDRVSGRRRLLITRGRVTATMPLPDDVDALQGLGESPAPTPTITLTLERTCPPARRLTLTFNDMEARFLLASAEQSLRGKRTEEAIGALQKAVTLAPKQADLRLTLARTLLVAGQAREAERILKEGMAATPLDIYWAVLEDVNLASLVPRLVPTTPSSGEEHWLPQRAAWSTTRRQVAIVEVEATRNISVFSNDGSEVFSAPLAFGPELDREGEVRPSAKKSVARRLLRAEQFLRGLDFRPLTRTQMVEAEQSDPAGRNGGLSWVRWKDSDLVASAGNTTVRVRRESKVIFEHRVDTMGTIRLDWGVHLADAHVLLLHWSHLSGNDECPNQTGVEIVELPATP